MIPGLQSRCGPRFSSRCLGLLVLSAIALALYGLVAHHAYVSSPASAALPGAAEAHAARGVVRAVHQAALSTDLVLPVIALPLREGDRFQRGDLLFELDCRRQRHELAALEAAMKEARVLVDSNEHLLARGGANRNDVETARARHEKTAADWRAFSVRLTACRVEAPFGGVVIELGINAHEIPTPNRPFITIASDRLLEVEIIIPSRRLDQARIGERLPFHVDETGALHELRVKRAGGAVDPVSQTMKIYAEFVEPSRDVLPGMSGTALLPPSGAQ